MDVTLTSIAHAASYLPDRNRVDDVADRLHMHLKSATSMIANYLRSEFVSAARTEYFDTIRAFAPTPGAASPPFGSQDWPSISLPVRGPVSGLVLRYREGYPMDEDFLWSDVEPLVEKLDYLFDAKENRVRLLFGTAPLIQGIQATFTSGYATQADTLFGARREDLYVRMGLETDLAPLAAMFMGVENKMLSDSATAAGTAPALASLEVAPPEAIAMHGVTLFTPRDAALVSVPQEMTLSLYGGPSGSETLLSQQVIQTPLPGQRYRLAGNPAQAYARYRITATGTVSATVAVSTVALEFTDALRLHMRASAPGALTDACAQLAAILYGRSVHDGVGKIADSGDRTYAGGLIPAEVKNLLAPYKSARVSLI